jgi:hypothetical protein
MYQYVKSSVPDEVVDAALDAELEDELGGNPSKFHIGQRHPNTRMALAHSHH